jgi:hypothetical protein
MKIDKGISHFDYSTDVYLPDVIFNVEIVIHK